MKVTRARYLDDGIWLDGFIIKRWFRRPVFYPFHPGCGFDSQVIFKKDYLFNQENVKKVEYCENVVYEDGYFRDMYTSCDNPELRVY